MLIKKKKISPIELISKLSKNEYIHIKDILIYVEWVKMNWIILKALI